VPEGEIGVLLAETEMFLWKLGVAEAEVVGALVVVDFVQRGPLVVVIKTLPAEVCFLNSSTDLVFPPEPLDRVD
jgi:hypothetical protein